MTVTVEVNESAVEEGGQHLYRFCKKSGAYAFATVFFTRDELVELRGAIDRVLGPGPAKCSACFNGVVEGEGGALAVCGRCRGSGVT